MGKSKKQIPAIKHPIIALRHHHTIAEVAGWVGAVSLLSGYLLVSYDVITPDSPVYHLLNMTAAIGLITIALVKKLYQSIVVNSVWLVIALTALLGLLLR